MTTRGLWFDGTPHSEAEWRDTFRHVLSPGVLRGLLNNLEVFGDSSGRQVKVKSGGAWMEGHFFDSDTEETLAIAANSSGNPRIDRAIVRADFVANTITFAILEGTPGASPSPPSVTTSATVWEISLAQVAVANGAATIAAGDVTDERPYAAAREALAATEFGAKKQFLVGTGADTFAIFTLGADGEIPVADSTQATGVKSAKPSIGDLTDFQYVKKTADQGPVNSNTTPQNDTHLVIALEANATYEVEALLHYVGAGAGGDVGGLKIAWTTPASSSGRWGVRGNGHPGDATVGREKQPTINSSGNHAWGGTTNVGTHVDALSAHIKGLIHTTNTGNLRLQWAQAVSNAVGVSVLAESHLIVKRVA